MLLPCLALVATVPTVLPKSVIMLEFRETPVLAPPYRGADGTPIDYATSAEFSLMNSALRKRGWKSKDLQFTKGIYPKTIMKQVLDKFPGGILYLVGDAKVPSLVEGLILQDIDRESTSLDWILDQLENKPTLLIADVGLTNLIRLDRRRNLSAIVSTGNWRDVSQVRKTGDFILAGIDYKGIGVFSVATWRALPFATDVYDLASRINQHSGTGSMAAMWTDLYPVRVLGSGSPLIPGEPLNPPTAQ